ncbi:MAG: hypothetical protein PHP07_07805 [Eubacteriales bacterium]|nr:hypothetical protein [Eubacteriales bacterium]MDD3109298.1 hypothetical protein [Eubacteriales bacterium]MDD3572832.1 hypothetical protein [Eubacteriales bacterium]MDD4133566.1 hypothetical protein [Eubacteriales bacterium]
MNGAIFLTLYLLAGLWTVRCLLPRQRVIARIWLGLSLGVFLIMWLPALVAFLRPYDAAAQWLSVAALAALSGAAFLLKPSAQPERFSDEDRKDLRLLLLFALPMCLLGMYLQYTHVLRPVDGALHVGQATYGDLPLHLAIATSLEGKALPAVYSILPGTRLGYPFLADSLATSFLALGWSLRDAMVIPAALMMALVFPGYLILARRACASRHAAALAFLFVFLNGGLGFLYAFDMAGVDLGALGQNQLQQGTWLGRVANILNGWYQTPANHAEFSTYNLRWSNIVADMLVPQRTFLAGWMVLLPCLYLVMGGMKSEDRDTRRWALAGVMAGGLPLVHTHSFLALAICSAAWFIHTLIRKKRLSHWLLYGVTAFLLALPQVVFFTFRQSGQEGFLRFHFNWVNNLGGAGLQDGYLWFYLKNVGLPLLLVIFSLFERNPWHKRLLLGALFIFIPAEMVLFQPNAYDNNKLFYAAWALAAIPAADYAVLSWNRLKAVRARPLMAVLAAGVMFTTGTLAIAREAVSDYPMFSREDLALADFVKENTPRDSRFVTGFQHINPISSLTGREIVVGPDLWLYYHGFDTEERQSALRAFFQSPEVYADVPVRYGADYILLGHEERMLGGNKEALDRLFDVVYDENGYTLFRVPEG